MEIKYLIKTITVLVIFCLSLVFSTISTAQQISVKDLDVLIGTWDVVEVEITGTGEKLLERGVRSCSYFLMDTYILCETRAKLNGKERIYQWMINYNQVDKRFEMIGIYSNWGRKTFDTIIVPDNRLRWEVKREPNVENGVERRVLGTVEFNGTDKFVWTVKIIKSTDSPTDWKPMFRETSLRKKISTD